MINIDNGCILIARQIIASGIWKKPSDYLKIWIYILCKVNHKDNYAFKRGENFFNWSEDIRDFKGITRNTLDNCIKWLKSTEQITVQKTTRGMILKVNNYGLYQDIHNYKKQDEIRNEIRKGYGKDTERVQIDTDTINKNDNNEKNDKNDLLGQKTKNFKKPSVNEILSYCSERKNNIDPERFFDFYEAKGWMLGKNKMKDWKAAVRTWEKTNKSYATATNIEYNEVDYEKLSR